MMFGIGIPELLVILVIALIFVGPERLPEVVKIFSRLYTDFRKATQGVSEELRNARQTLEEEVRQAERKLPEEQSPQSTTLLPGGQPEGALVSVSRTRGQAQSSSAADTKKDDYVLFGTKVA